MYMCVCTCVYVHVCMYMCVCTCAYVYIGGFLVVGGEEWGKEGPNAHIGLRDEAHFETSQHYSPLLSVTVFLYEQ